MTKKKSTRKTRTTRTPKKRAATRQPARRSEAAATAVVVHVRCEVRALRGVRPLLERVARHVVAAERFAEGELSIVIVGAKTMARLHDEYMGDPTPTDVLTFDLGTSRQRRRLEGEIVVCADVAAEHSGRRGVRKELALYVSHGVLHLAGYDDHAPEGYRRMHAREDELLEQLGLGRPFEHGGDHHD